MLPKLQKLPKWNGNFGGEGNLTNFGNYEIFWNFKFELSVILVILVICQVTQNYPYKIIPYYANMNLTNTIACI